MTAEMVEEAAERAHGEMDNLRREIQLVNSLIPSTYSIRCFPAKWQSIRGKLEQISSGLTAAASDSGPEGNQALSEMAKEIALSAGETQLLAQQCGNESYSGGKLQLRSDLNVATGKLDIHLKRLSEIYASGVLTHPRAIILSRPGTGASREEMKFYVKDLFSRLRIGGGSEMRARGLATLNEILFEDEKYVSVVAETVDGISLLVSLLEFGEMGIQDEAAKAVSVIAGFDGYRGALIAAGAIAQMTRVLETGSGAAKERAARSLWKLTENSDNAWSVSAHGGVPILLKIFEAASSSIELICSAGGILRNLSGVSEIRRFIVEEGIVSVLVKLSRSKDELLQIQAIDFITVLASEDANIQQKVVREGMIESLVQVLDPNSPSSAKAKELAIRAIECLCSSAANSMNILMGSEFLSQLLFFLRNGEVSVQDSALKAVCRFCCISDEVKRVMGDIGFMPELVNLLEARSFEVREMAAEALCSMLSVQRNRRQFIQKDGNVDRILQLLDPVEEKSVTKKSLLPVLMSLTNSNRGRRKLVASEYARNLEKLAENDVTDAKKIIKKLSNSRFRIMLNSIWSS